MDDNVLGWMRKNRPVFFLFSGKEETVKGFMSLLLSCSVWLLCVAGGLSLPTHGAPFAFEFIPARRLLSHHVPGAAGVGLSPRWDGRADAPQGDLAVMEPPRAGRGAAQKEILDFSLGFNNNKDSFC